MPGSESLFGTLDDGTDVSLFTLDNGRGLVAQVSALGATLTSLRVPDAAGQTADVVLGYDRLADYLADVCYFGASIGRYANRIGGAAFELDEIPWLLIPNEGRNQLHGGPGGFHRAVWEAGRFESGPEPLLELGYVSAPGEEGFPGALYVTATFSLGPDALRIDYEAACDAPTPVNLTNHAYFNLSGAGRGDILEHRLTLYASRFTPVDRELLPTGEIRPVAGSPLDFTSPASIGARIGRDCEQLANCGGYDHNYVLDKAPNVMGLAARVVDPASGRVMELFASQPGLQLYAGNMIPRNLAGKGGRRYGPRSGFCLEPQHFPDSPNRPEFPSAILRPGQTYRHSTLLRFSVV